MGSDFGQWAEWNHEQSLDWHLMQYDRHQQLQRLVHDLNKVYKSEPALYTFDFDSRGFEGIDASDWQNSILSFIRKGPSWEDTILAVCNFTPMTHKNYRIGVPHPGFWKEILNSNANGYGGSGHGNAGGLWSQPISFQGRNHSLNVTIPPLGVVYFKIDPQR